MAGPPQEADAAANLLHGAHLATALALKLSDSRPYALGPSAHLTTVYLQG